MEDEKFVQDQETFSDGEDMSFDDFTKGGSFLKNPAVGESIEFTLSKIIKKKAKKVVNPKNPKKSFDVKMSGVDYYYEFITSKSETYTPLSWQIIGKVKAIGRKLGHLQGLNLKISHVADGFKDKDAQEIYKVYVKNNDKYQELVDNDWK